MKNPIDPRADYYRPEICPLLIASTTHVTADEAQIPSDNGHSRGEYGWFLYVGQPGDAVLTEIAPVSDGLAAVVSRTQQVRCPYVLLNRDAETLPGVPTYDW